MVGVKETRRNRIGKGFVDGRPVDGLLGSLGLQVPHFWSRPWSSLQLVVGGPKRRPIVARF